MYYLSFNNIKKSQSKFNIIQIALTQGLEVRDYFDWTVKVHGGMTIRKTPAIIEIVIPSVAQLEYFERMLKTNNIEHYRSATRIRPTKKVM